MKSRNIFALGLGIAGSLVMGTMIASNTYASPNPAFTDDNFYACVVSWYNQVTNSNVSVSTNLTDAQLAQITSLQCEASANANYAVISDLSGIEKLTNLSNIRLTGTAITNLDLSHTSSISSFFVTNNYKLATVNLGNQPNLTHLYAYNNAISSINVSGATSITYLNLYNNKLSSIDVSKNTSLNTLVLSKNNFSTIDLSKVSNNLNSLFIYDNNLTELDLTSRDFYNNGQYGTLYTSIYADDILVKTGVYAYYDNENKNYVITLSWLAEALGLQYMPTNTDYVYSTIPTTSTYYYTNPSLYKEYVVITDPDNYPGYVQVVSNNKQNIIGHDPTIGQDTTKRTLKLQFEKYQAPEDNNGTSGTSGNTPSGSTSNTGSSSSNNGGLKAPDTGFLIGNIEGGVLIGISVTIVAGIAAAIGILRHIANRRSHRVKFHK